MSAAVDDAPHNLIASSATLAHVRALFRLAHPPPRIKNATLFEDWHLTQDRQTGMFRVRRLGDDYREITTLGPLQYENGSRGGVRWQQNRNGITFTFANFHERDRISDRAWQSNDERDVRLVGESVALSAYVVEIDPPNGRLEWLYIDKRSGLLVRRDRVERGKRTTITYDEFKVFEGAQFPGRIRSVDSLGNEREQTLIVRYLDTTPDIADVAIPPSRRTLVEFPPGAVNAHAPVRTVNGLLVTRVTVEGHPYDFLVDSGAAGIIIDPAIVETLGFPRYGERVGQTIGSFNESTSIVPSMTVGALHLRNVVVRTVPIPFRADERTRIMGLLGFDFFAENVLHVDIARGMVDAIHPSVFRPPADSTSIALALDDKQPAAPVRVGPVAARMVLDTGANRTVFTASFARRIEFANASASPVSAQFHGIGGVGAAQTVRLRELELAGYPLSEPIVDVSSADLGFEDVDGVIGSDVLGDFDVFFEYRSNTAHIRRITRSDATVGAMHASAPGR